MVIIMKRYSDIEIQKDGNGRRFRKTTLLPVIEPHVDDTYIIGQIGDRLDTLAYKYYGDSSLWWIIARANNLGNGDLVVPSGKQIRIPSQITSIKSEYKSLNS